MVDGLGTFHLAWVASIRMTWVVQLLSQPGWWPLQEKAARRTSNLDITQQTITETCFEAGWDHVSKHQLSVKDMISRSRSQEPILKTRRPRQHHIKFKPVVVVQPRGTRTPEVETTLTRQVARHSSKSMSAMSTPNVVGPRLTLAWLLR